MGYSQTLIDLQRALQALQSYIDKMVTSDPLSGQYKVAGIRLDADKKIVITYNEDAES